MTRPDSNPDDRALQEVQDSYRTLPPVEPDAVLDARVRAAVAEELAGDAVHRSTPLAAVIPFARWRRAALPMAAAAALLVAIGVDRFQQAAPPTRTAAPSPTAVVAPPPPPPPAAAAALAWAPLPSTGLQALQPTPGPAPARAITETKALAELKREVAARASGYADRSALEVSPRTETLAAAPAAPPVGLAQASKPAPPDEDAVVFDQIRKLIATQRRDEAKEVLQHWRAAHPQVPLPPDLEPLAAEAQR